MASYPGAQLGQGRLWEGKAYEVEMGWKSWVGLGEVVGGEGAKYD